MLIRTALKETMAKHLWAQFFPTAHAIDLRRMPSADDVVARMGSGHFKLVTHRTVAHRFADDAKSYVAKIRLRGLSALQMIPETEFCRGIDLLERHLRTVPTNASSFTEDMDLFCFAKPLVDP